MNEQSNAAAVIPPRQHFLPPMLREDPGSSQPYALFRIDPITRETGFEFSGAFAALSARNLAPPPKEVQDMVIRLRTDFEFSRGQLAAYLAVGESTIKAWETGRRIPALPARRLIWLLDLLFRAEGTLNFASFLLWSRAPKRLDQSAANGAVA